jgi:hypothetical protein
VQTYAGGAVETKKEETAVSSFFAYLLVVML